MLSAKFQLTHAHYFKLAKGNFRLVYYVFTPLMLTQIALGVWRHQTDWLKACGLFVLGVFLWGLLEYVLHRIPFHMNSKNGLVQFFTSGFHQLHHQIPQSKEYIAAPIYLALWGQFACEAIVLCLTQDWAKVHLIGAGISLGYMYYEWIHYLSHHRTLKSAYYKRLKELHLQHHFKNSKKTFGVSYPLWDHVFGTFLELHRKL